MRLLPPTLTFAALLSLTSAGLADDSGYKEFKSWQVLCSQTLSCSMRQFLSDTPFSSFELQRSAQPKAPVLLVISPRDSSIIDGNGDITAAIAVDGGKATAFTSAAISIDADAGILSLSGALIDSGFVDSIKNGSAAKLTITRGTKSIEGEIPLAGAAASLLFIDEFQKRVGHTDALTAKGDKAPNPAPPLSDIRRFSDFPEAVRARFAAGGECGETEEAMLDGNALAHKLADEQTLYVTPCGMGGAYNMPYAVMVDVYGTVSSLAFPVMQEGAPSAVTTAYNLSYDHEAGTFSGFFKGRGVGDCGTASSWKFAEGAMGPQLVLVEESFRDCPSEIEDNENSDPASWPKSWPLK